MNLDNFLTLNNFFNAVPLLDEVWQVVPEDTFVDDDLDLIVDISSYVPKVSSVLQVGYTKQIVMADCFVLLSDKLDAFKAVFNNQVFKSSIKANLIPAQHVWPVLVPHLCNWDLNRTVLDYINLLGVGPDVRANLVDVPGSVNA